MHPAAQDILDFWFGSSAPFHIPQDDRHALWWGGGEVLDRDIEARFGALLARVQEPELQAWTRDPMGRLALVVLIDQFSRNIFRGTPQVYALDSVALRLCLEGMDHGHDQAMGFFQRSFLYMPLQHAEDLAMQERERSKPKGGGVNIIDTSPLANVHGSIAGAGDHFAGHECIDGAHRAVLDALFKEGAKLFVGEPGALQDLFASVRRQ